MVIYICIALFLYATRYSNKKSIVLFAFFILVFVAGFRDITVGRDTQNYLSRYERGYDFESIFLVREGTHEIFYNSLFAFSNYWGLSYQNVLLIQAVLFLSLLYFFFNKKQSTPLLGLFVFYMLYNYMHFLNVSRQMISVALCSFAYLFIEDIFNERKIALKKLNAKSISKALCFIGIVFLSLLIHSSSVLMLLLIPLLFVDIKITSWSIALVLSLFVGWRLDLSSYLQEYAILFGVADVYSNYFERVDTFFPIGNAMNTIVFIMLYWRYRDVINFDKNIYMKAWYISIIIMNLFAFTSEWIGRATFCFTIGCCVIIPMCLESKRDAIGSSVIYLYLLVSFFKELLRGVDGILPYNFCF